VRGDFFLQRPGFQTITLSYDLPATQNYFQTGLFQGRGYYKPDAGAESIMASVGGHLFKITPDTNSGAVVTDISIPNHPNPAGQTQAWLFQAENYLVCNDGVSAPLIYNGNTTFRSNNGAETILGVVGITFAVPSIGSTVPV